MKTRDFDPVLSAALRNELESLADGAGRTPAVRSTLRRPQVWITAVTALVLLVATLGVLRITAARHTAPEPAIASLADPLAQLGDPADPAYVEGGVLPLMQARGTGSGTYALEVPEGITSVRAYIRCSPTVRYRIVIGKFVSAECSADAQVGFGDVPVKAGRYGVVVSVPADTVWRMVVIATPDPTGTTTYSTLRVTDGPTIAYPAPERDDDVPVGYTSGGTGTTKGSLISEVDELALVTSCRGSGGLVITMSNGLQFGTDQGPIPCTRTGQRSMQALGNDTTAGYRSDGVLTYTVRATGDVRWSAVFSTRTEERLPYPAVSGTVVARTRGSSIDSAGSLDRVVGSLRVVITCRGTGSLSVGTGENGTSVSSPTGADAWCDRFEAKRSEYTTTVDRAGLQDGKQRYTILPKGDVLWTVTFVDAG